MKSSLPYRIGIGSALLFSICIAINTYGHYVNSQEIFENLKYLLPILIVSGLVEAIILFLDFKRKKYFVAMWFGIFNVLIWFVSTCYFLSDIYKILEYNSDLHYQFYYFLLSSRLVFAIVLVTSKTGLNLTLRASGIIKIILTSIAIINNFITIGIVEYVQFVDPVLPLITAYYYYQEQNKIVNAQNEVLDAK